MLHTAVIKLHCYASIHIFKYLHEGALFRSKFNSSFLTHQNPSLKHVDLKNTFQKGKQVGFIN